MAERHLLRQSLRKVFHPVEAEPPAEDQRPLTDLEAICRTAASHFQTAVQLTTDPILRGTLREQRDRYRRLAVIAAALGRLCGAEPLIAAESRETLARLFLRLRVNFSPTPEETLQLRCDKIEEEVATCLTEVLTGSLPALIRAKLTTLGEELSEARWRLRRQFQQRH